MPLTVRNCVAATEQEELWRRWKEGQAFSEIGRALGKSKQSVHYVVEKRGGVAPPPQRR